ncbi:hypothetical protein ACFV83_04630 [Streptomyces pharetrae]|jgi:hypothetical protein|uniref:hypothetical protein n=1 Tax=Streptomyces pharetrae TaxID=291370 RepID=UPI0036583822
MPNPRPVDRTAPQLITRIEVKTQTDPSAGAGTNGWVFLGIGGREFQLDTLADDFEPRASDRPVTDTFVLGEGANILNASGNDPRDPQLHVTDLDRHPVYLRFQPRDNDDDWRIDRVDITVTGTAGGAVHHYDYQALADVTGAPKTTLRLSRRSGRILHLSSLY